MRRDGLYNWCKQCDIWKRQERRKRKRDEAYTMPGGMVQASIYAALPLQEFMPWRLGENRPFGGCFFWVVLQSGSGISQLTCIVQLSVPALCSI